MSAALGECAVVLVDEDRTRVVAADVERHAAAASPALAAGRLHYLLRDSSLARQAATNSSLPAETMHAILDEVGIPR